MYATISRLNIHEYSQILLNKFNANIYYRYGTSKVYTANNSHWSWCNLQINTNRLIIEHVTCNFHGSDSSIFPFFSFHLDCQKKLETFGTVEAKLCVHVQHMLCTVRCCWQWVTSQITKFMLTCITTINVTEWMY